MTNKNNQDAQTLVTSILGFTDETSIELIKENNSDVLYRSLHILHANEIDKKLPKWCVKRIKFGINAINKELRARRKINFFFRWYDMWVGAYWDSKNRTLYVCPIPMFGFKITF